MSIRTIYVLVASFWVLMNILLWRAEFGRGKETLSEISLETVVDRLLNAPDPSVLQILHHGETRGSLRWIPTVEESGRDTADDRSLIPEGMVQATGYNLDLDLNLITGSEGPAGRTRLLAHLDLDTNQVWKSASLRIFQRPATWEITTRAGDDSIRLRFEEGKTSWEQSFRLGDARRLNEFLGPFAALIPGPLAADFAGFDPTHIARQFNWSAHNDWLRIGRNRVRTYRIQANLLGRYELVAHLSRAGEILQVKLPDGLLLQNESIPFSGRR